MGMINPDEIREIAEYCRFTGNVEVPKDLGRFIVCEINSRYVFDIEKIEEKKSAISNILLNLDYHLFCTKLGGGGADSLFSMITDFEGTQWGDINQAAELAALGYAAGFIKFPIQKDRWKFLSKGLPLVSIDLYPENEKKTLDIISYQKSKK